MLSGGPTNLSPPLEFCDAVFRFSDIIGGPVQMGGVNQTKAVTLIAKIEKAAARRFMSQSVFKPRNTQEEN